MRNFLIVAPHADDEILGCGGTAAKLIKNGWKCYVAIMTNAHKGAPELYSKSEIEKIRNEAKLAHSFLGVEETYFFDFPAPCLDCYPNYKIASSLSKILKDIKPSLVFAPFSGDAHLDHYYIYRATLTATRPFQAPFVSALFLYETLSETEWSGFNPSESFTPNCFSNITDFIETKVKAMKFYDSQVKSETTYHPRTLRGIKTLANYRGQSSGSQFAEAFIMDRGNLDDLLNDSF
jgi:N-acetylglucosamine malate deacetylase 1